jgi:thymidine kinase
MKGVFNMAQLYFNYGVMGSSKTANALMVCYNYEERGQKVLLVKSALDTRDGENIVKSRIGLSRACIPLEKLVNDMCFSDIDEYDAIVVDEVQFAKPEEIDFLATIVDKLNIPVLCYGLRADFKNNLFPGSERLLTIADNIKEIKTICWCGKKATCNARYDEDGIVRDGEQIKLGANNSYIGLCRKHFLEGNLGPDFKNFI